MSAEVAHSLYESTTQSGRISFASPNPHSLPLLPLLACVQLRFVRSGE